MRYCHNHRARFARYCASCARKKGREIILDALALLTLALIAWALVGWAATP